MAGYVDGELKKIGITISKPVLATVCVLFGIMVILLPTLLVWIVGLFLMIQGALLFTDYLEQERPRTTRITTNGVKCNSCGERSGQKAAYCRRCGKQLVQAEHIVTAQPQEIVE